MDEKSEFAAAVNAIVMSHKKLYDLLVAALEYYTPTSVGMPPRGKRISRILDCEANGSHALIEDLATAAKAVPRGELGELPDLLVAECRDFLDFLEERLHCGECAAAINDIRQTEEAFVNLIKGVSGCDPNISVDDYSVRIDMFVRDLKAFFRDFGKAIVKLEYEIAQRKKKPESIAAKTAARDLFRQLLDGAHDAGDAPPKTAAAVKKRRARRGIGGKGPRTEFMISQLRAFVRFLTASNYDGNLKKINSLAAQCWAKNNAKWNKAAKATGQQKGYSSARVLADAYRKSE